MDVQVRYFSRGGNTKRLAEAIAGAVGVEATPLGDGASESADLLLLGASVYWGGIDGEVRRYIEALDPARVKAVAVFSTSALSERAYADVRRRLEARGIRVLEQNFYCRGEFAALHRGRPNADDLAAARAFAASVTEGR